MTKKQFIIQVIAFVVACLSLPFALAFGKCPKGTEEHQGMCAALPSPEESTLAPLIPPSDEKPRRSQQPEWITGEVHADLTPSVAAQDAKQDEAKMKADAEGKKSAGVPVGKRSNGGVE